MIAEKHIRHYNALKGNPITKEKLVKFHSALKKDIDSKRIDSHVPYGVELIEIEKRIAAVLKKINGSKVMWEKVELKPIKIKTVQPQVKTVSKKKEIEQPVNEAVLYGLETQYPEGEKETLGFTQGGQQKIYDMVTSMILDTMKKDGLFWRKEWSVKNSFGGGETHAVNFKTKTAYRGINFWITNFIVPSYGYKSIYFLTFKQAKDLGGNVKKGAKSFPILYYNFYYIVTKPERKTITEEKYKALTSEQRTQMGARKVPVVMYYSVFNGDDIEGIEFPKVEVKKLSEKEKIESCETIVAGMPKRPDIRHGGDRAFYSSADYVQMPLMETFSKEQSYYSTLFHELIHSTGHESRIGRKFGKKFGDKDYSYEELIAELGASYLCAESGILYFTLNNSAAYLKGWSAELHKQIKDDSQFFMHAAASAQKASDFILDRSAIEKPVIVQQKQVAGIVKKPKLTKRILIVDDKQPSNVSLNGVVDASALKQLKFKKLELTGQYKKDLHKLYSDTLIMIWGSPGSGKTVWLLLFAQYLAEVLGLRVLYLANEEWGRSTLTEKVDQFNIGHKNLKMAKDFNAIKTAGLTLNDFDAVFMDTVQTLGLNLDGYKKLVEDNPGRIYVAVIQSTKEGDFRGGKDWEHEMDIAGEIRNRKLILRKNRLDPNNSEKANKLLVDEIVEEQKQKKHIRQLVAGETKPVKEPATIKTN